MLFSYCFWCIPWVWGGWFGSLYCICLFFILYSAAPGGDLFFFVMCFCLEYPLTLCILSELSVTSFILIYMFINNFAINKEVIVLVFFYAFKILCHSFVLILWHTFMQLCKIDSEGKARKVTGCSCVVVKVCFSSWIEMFGFCFHPLYMHA